MSIISSLSNRIFFATALLAVVSIGVAVYRVNVAVTAQAERELQRGLDEAATLVENYRRTLIEHYRREARLIADLPKLKAAVETNDPPTVEPIAREYRQQLEADLFVITGRGGRLLAAIDAPAAEHVARLDGVRAALAGREAVSFWPAAGGVREVVSVPILLLGPGGPELFGTLNIGFALDARAAARLKALTASEIAFLFDGEIQASTLPREHWPAIADLAGRPDATHRQLDGEEYVAVSRALLRASPANGGTPAGTTIVLRSRTERLRVLSGVHKALAATALIAVLAAIGLSFALARTVTRPLGVITNAMRELASSGDLTHRIPEPPATAWDDEDAKLLARTFNTMTASIARFQREAAQRERLSSLGRLSTVIAHEIRNPLMIIKSALRPLKRESATPELRKIGEDIEEEIARLNRIVSDVLDFARPIRFELAPADLNVICQDAARAVWPEGAGQAPDIIVEPALPIVVTDAERLRHALINVLTNARHAAEAHATPGRAARVSLTTERRGATARITVRDNGPGITADALPRVFEPFFTTKRTGSGIGLAIARNIIEGLGGTIAVAASGARGTAIAVELPVSPQAEARSVSA
ncbi:MAG: HAMP domain-containing protein [Acidobacteria bacterium]|nr:HAMP domain-containing protein [Acidobacteriota bacterium]